MSSDFSVAPDETNTVTGSDSEFLFGIPWGDGVAWSDGAVLRIASEDGSEVHDFAKSDGQASGDLVVFKFADAQPGIHYRGMVVDSDYTFELFAPADLCAVQHVADPTSHLPFGSGEAGDESDDDSDTDADDAAADDAGASGAGGDDASADDASAGGAGGDDTSGGDDSGGGGSAAEDPDGARCDPPDDDGLVCAANPPTAGSTSVFG